MRAGLVPAALVGVAMGALALVPLFGSGYHLAVAIGILNNLVLATAWALFSGPTRYVSLATAAFFGIGAYTVAILGETLPWPLVLAAAAGIGIAVALVVGLSTLRLSGIYFVIFTFGLAELVRQLVTWWEVNVGRSVGRYIFLDVTQAGIFWQLFGLAALVFASGWWIGRSRLGLALRVIGDDEVVARHCGIDTTRAKLLLFAASAAFMTLAGAIMAPRWTYLDPSIAFNPAISFQALIMALLGGAGRLWGPLLGVVPLTLLFEVLGAHFPNAFSILLGLVFMLIVYAVPNGVAGWFDGAAPRRPWFSRRSPASEPLLAVSGLTRRFGGLVAVDGLGFTLDAHEILGLIGPNGSGKTTALHLLSGGLKPDAGEIRLAGRPIAGLSPHRIARLGIARTFQLVRVLPSLDARENVVAGLAFRDAPLWARAAEAEADRLLDRVGLAGRAHQRGAELTYIDQKRLELARALALAPRLLLLDEWLAGLNPSELLDGVALIGSLRREGIAIVMVEHVMDAVRTLCDRCVVMNAGAVLAAGPTGSVLADPDVVAAYLGGPDA